MTKSKKVLSLKRKLAALTFVIVILLAVLGMTLYNYDHMLKFPAWAKSYPSNSSECLTAEPVQQRLNPDFAKVSIFNISTPKGEMKAWYVRATKNRTGKGSILVHGGGADHNLMIPYAHLLSEKGWDSLIVDLPNHGCSYSNKKGIQFGVVESENFGRFYEKAESLFKVDAIIGTSLGSTVVALYSFKTGKPDKIIMENPMLNLSRIIQDQKAYYIPTMFRSWLQWELLSINSDLNLSEITMLKPQPNQHLLVMYGTNDVLTPPNPQAAEVVKAWGPNIELKILGGAKHSQLYQHSPGYVQKTVWDFLK